MKSTLDYLKMRQEHKFSDLTERTGIARCTLQSWAAGKVPQSVQAAASAARVYGVSIEELFWI